MVIKDDRLFIKLYNSNYKKLLIKLLYKFNINIKNIIKLIDNDQNDEIIYNYIMNNKKINNNYGSNSNRGIERAKEIVNILNNIDCNYNKIGNLLDIGCNTGEITRQVKKLLKLNKKKSICIDVGSFSGRKIIPTNDITYHIYDGINIPFQNDEFYLVIMMQVLHHVENVEQFMENLYRVIKPNSIILFREHDCIDNKMSYLIDVEHMIWSSLENTDYKTFIETYYGNYFSRSELEELMTKYGFKKCNINDNLYVNNRGPTNYYYSVFIKNNQNGGSKIKYKIAYTNY